MRKFIALLLVFAVLLPTASATAQTERLLPSNVASISSKNEALSLYQSLVAGNSNQMEKEVSLAKGTLSEPNYDNAEEYLQQNYNLMYQLSKDTPDFETIESMTDGRGVYYQIQYDNNTNSYTMSTLDTNNNCVSILINDEEYVLNIEDDNLVMYLNDAPSLDIFEQLSMLDEDEEESVSVMAGNSPNGSSWIPYSNQTYYTNAWVKILEVFSLATGTYLLAVSCTILGYISLASAYAVSVGSNWLATYYVVENDYCRSDCALYHQMVRQYYDEGSGTGNMIYIKTKQFTYWSAPQAGSGCMQYPYPGY